MEMKICKLCQKEKSVDHFYLCGKHRSSRCKKCFGEYQKHNRNRKQTVKKYDDKNRELLNEKERNRYHSDIEKRREYERKKRSRLRKENPEKFKEYNRTWKLKQYHNKKSDVLFMIAKNLRSRFLQAVKKEYKHSSCMKLLGCSVPEFKKYIEDKFTTGMSWDNHGIKGWHYDHIVPCASFDQSDIEQQMKCWHYTNFQPLWWYDNLIKSDKNEEARATTTPASSTTTTQF